MDEVARESKKSVTELWWEQKQKKRAFSSPDFNTQVTYSKPKKQKIEYDHKIRTNSWESDADYLNLSNDIKIDETSSDTDTDVEQIEDEEFKIPQINGEEKNLQKFFVHESNREQQEGALELLVVDLATNCTKKVILNDDWSKLMINIGDQLRIFSLEGEPIEEDPIVINNLNNYCLVLNPDHLVPIKTIGATLFCERKATLQQVVQSNVITNVNMLRGEVIHSLLQAALREANFGNDFLQETLKNILKENILKFSLLDEPIDFAQCATSLQQWASLFYNKRFVSTKHNTAATIKEVVAIEESIWSKKFGLKGKIDFTALIECEQGTEKSLVVVPFEIKTGKGNMSDHAQIGLYSLLISQRLGAKKCLGGLTYVRIDGSNNECFVKAFKLSELKSLMLRRNMLTSALYKPTGFHLPAPTRIMRNCETCNYRLLCGVYLKNFSTIPEENSPYKSAISHLRPEDFEFFHYWDDMLYKEAAHELESNKKLWNNSSMVQYKNGMGCGHLKLIQTESEPRLTPSLSEEFLDLDSLEKVMYSSNSFLYRFKSSKKLSSLSIGVGDYVCLSTESGNYGVASGTVFDKTEYEITMLMNEKLATPYYLLENFTGQLPDIEDFPTSPCFENVFWRIDKLELQSVFSKMRLNLVELMLPNNTDVRSLIIHQRKQQTPKLNLLELKRVPPEMQELMNQNQKEVICKALSAEKFLLLHGMPGTGKSTTIALLIEFLVSIGKRVLVTSFTHSAIDHLLLKLKKDFGMNNFLRIGKEERVHKEIRPHTLQIHTEDSLKRISGFPVVAVTCHGIRDPILQKLKFDYTIIDEGSQISLPLSLGPLFFSSKFVIVGDHYQLPALATTAKGLSQSLFKLLVDLHPESVVVLQKQYRMNSAIMTVANRLVYKDKMICGTQEVANSRLIFPQPFDPKFAPVFDPTREVVFMNTDCFECGREVKKGKGIVNEFESKLVGMMCKAALEAGIQPCDIGIISPFRAQVREIAQQLSKIARGGEIEALTVDKYQGKEKEMILISLTRSNEKGLVGELIEDWRRLNVAFTRAKTKLIVIGSKSTCSNNSFLQQFLRIIPPNHIIDASQIINNIK